MITTRLELASRIQLLLFRELGDKIDIERMLANEVYARDVLLVCDAMHHEEFTSLAARFREASNWESGPGRAAQRNDWARNTSGFGVTKPPAEPPPAEPRAAPTGWLAATRRWLRR